MLQTLVSSAGRFLSDLSRTWLRGRHAPFSLQTPASAAPSKYRRLCRVTLTDDVSRTLFDEYAAHRRGTHGDHETGWILLGLREAEEAIVLATLPAGANASAGVAHVQFNSAAQALGSRIVRQQDRRLTILGVVHTHPGSLRHPSDGDYQGDSQWVRHLRGGDGIFGIGTVDKRSSARAVFARQPRPYVETLGELMFCWYALAQGDADYRPLPYNITLGPDLARPLHPLWPVLETHAEHLERLYRQQANVAFRVLPGKRGPNLAVTIPLAEPFESLRVLIDEEQAARYYLLRAGDVLEVDPPEKRIDRSVYLLLAELAAQSS